jgi:hypothetical protein
MNHITSTPFWQTASREDVPVPREYLRMLAVLAETSAQMDLGLHCSRCGQDLHGANAPADRRWSLACGCRTFVGGNPLHGGDTAA